MVTNSPYACTDVSSVRVVPARWGVWRCYKLLMLTNKRHHSLDNQNKLPRPTDTPSQLKGNGWGATYLGLKMFLELTSQRHFRYIGNAGSNLIIIFRFSMKSLKAIEQKCEGRLPSHNLIKVKDKSFQNISPLKAKHSKNSH